MKWTLITIEAESNNIDEICAILSAHGIDGIEIADPSENLRRLDEEDAHSWDYIDESLITQGPALIKFYLPFDDNDDADALTVALPRGASLRAANAGVNFVRPLADALGNLGKVTVATVEDDWTDAWREHYKPFKIGKRIVVRPFWEEYNPHDNQAYDEEIVFTIDPGHVFGTGQHQSTSLCINLLDKHLQKGDKILDIGCGSGILAIIALLLGAAHATAVDIDPAAAKMTITNAELNDIPKEKITAFNGNIFDEGESSYGTYDIVVANIVADVIIKLAPLAAKMLTTNGRFIEGGINGRFITGGIVEERKEEVAEALAQAGFSIGETLIQDGWVAFFCFVSLQRGRT